MSGIDGRNVCKKLKDSAHTKDIPVIFMSANSHLKEIAEEYNVDYIEKPFEMNYLLNKVQGLVPALQCNEQLVTSHSDGIL